MAGSAERRKGDRRTMPGQHIDVTRLEHENLCGQMDDVLQRLRRVERELSEQNNRLSALENATATAKRSFG